MKKLILIICLFISFAAAAQNNSTRYNNDSSWYYKIFGARELLYTPEKISKIPTGAAIRHNASYDRMEWYSVALGIWLPFTDSTQIAGPFFNNVSVQNNQITYYYNDGTSLTQYIFDTTFQANRFTYPGEDDNITQTRAGNFNNNPWYWNNLFALEGYANDHITLQATKDGHASGVELNGTSRAGNDSTFFKATLDSLVLYNYLGKIKASLSDVGDTTDKIVSLSSTGFLRKINYDSVGGGVVINNINKKGKVNIAAGTNITINGIGTAGNPFVINSAPLDTVNVANVLSYGADSTGVNDATAAINAAIANAWANGHKKRVYIPHGTYLVTVAALKAGSQINKQGIVLINDIEIFGDGERTIIKAANAGSATTSTYYFYPILNGLNGAKNVKIHDLKIDGNKSNYGNYTANPYTNPAGYFSDTANRWSVSAIMFKDGDNNEVYNVHGTNAQLNGVFALNSTRTYVHHSIFDNMGGSAVGFLRYATGIVENVLGTQCNSDIFRVDSSRKNNEVLFTNCEGSFSGTNASATNWFAGFYLEGYGDVTINNCYAHDNSAYGIDHSSDSSVVGKVQVLNSIIKLNGNGGIITSGKMTIKNNWIENNGIKSDGTHDTKSNYNPAAVVVNNAVNLLIEGNKIIDTSGVQLNFMKTWGGGASFGYKNSDLKNNLIKGVADSSHAYEGDAGGNSIALNLMLNSSGQVINAFGNNYVLTNVNGVWMPRASTGGSGGVTLTNTQIAYGDVSNQVTSDANFFRSSGAVTIQNNGIGTTSTNALILDNTTAAANGAQQQPGNILLRSRAWKSNATAASQTHDFYIQNLPSQGTSISTGTFAIANSINSGALNYNLTITDQGAWNFSGATGQTFDFNGWARIGSGTASSTQTLSLGVNGSAPTATQYLLWSQANLTNTSFGYGIYMNNQMQVTSPASAATNRWAGVFGQMKSSASINYTASPFSFEGVWGSIEFQNAGTAVDWAQGFGVHATVAVNTLATKTLTKGIGLYVDFSAGAVTPTGKIGTATGVFIDSVQSNMFTTAAQGIYQRDNYQKTMQNVLESNLLIGTGSKLPSAALQVNSTTQGVLWPRMTTTQRNAISSPAEGLTVYDTDLHKGYQYDGTAWQALYSMPWFLMIICFRRRKFLSIPTVQVSDTTNDPM